MRDDSTPRWQRYVAVFFFITLLALNIYLVRASTESNRTLRAEAVAAQRLDCARQVNTDQQSTRDAATLADRNFNQFFFNALFNQTVKAAPATPEVLAEYQRLLTETREKDAAVAALPDAAKLVNSRCPGS